MADALKNRCLIEGTVRSVNEVKFKSGDGSLVSIIMVQPIQKGQDWIDNPVEFSAFGPLKEDLLRNCKPGMTISVDGVIQGREYNDRTYINFRANKVEFIGGEAEPEPEPVPEEEVPF